MDDTLCRRLPSEGKNFSLRCPSAFTEAAEPRAGRESYGVKIIIVLKEFSQNVSFGALRWGHRLAGRLRAVLYHYRFFSGCRSQKVSSVTHCSCLFECVFSLSFEVPFILLFCKRLQLPSGMQRASISCFVGKSH